MTNLIMSTEVFFVLASLFVTIGHFEKWIDPYQMIDLPNENVEVMYFALVF